MAAPPAAPAPRISKSLEEQLAEARRNGDWLSASQLGLQFQATRTPTVRSRAELRHDLRRAAQVRRLAQRTTAESALAAAEALHLYAEVLTKLQQYGEATPPVRIEEFFQQGVEELRRAWDHPSFRQQYLGSNHQWPAEWLRAKPSSAREAREIVRNWLMQAQNQWPDLPPSVVVLEFI
ncbi:MAG: hypothetical protein ACRCZF_09825, partial [Gemmataceae bacterium]